MDQAIRNKLRNVVTQCRKLLEDAVAQVLQGQFGIYSTGKKDEVHAEDEARMTHLAEEDRACRRDLLDHFEHIKALGYKPTDALAQLVREVAFTHLNRLCAYKMMEARAVIINGRPFREAVSRGLKSQGFLFYLADHPEDEKRCNSGQQDVAYRHFLDCLGGTLSEEIGVLFSPNDPANRLYPPQRVLDGVLDLINTGDIKPDEKELQEAWPKIWCADETIGWVYQYFTPAELRDQARKESAAPRNSYELAFRNQFFTPRYVVQFLSDNTLGRIWYEMRKGETRLRDQCGYMVCRPNEVFLAEGQEPPKATQEARDDPSQEGLLKLRAFVAYRPKKDPRALEILDPACGSAHFLLYCFDLLATIYEEAYDDHDLGPALKRDYPTRDDLRRAVPGLILTHNLHGIDIDLRATQIAALALWLRCQRAYQEWDIKKDRPQITRSNIVCAEPMPGEKQLLEDFLKTLRQDRLETLIRRVMQVPEGTRVRATQSMVDGLCELVRVVWEVMRLAGEAGSLLKVEEELQEAIRIGQQEWEEKQPLFRVTEFGISEQPREAYLRLVPGEGVSFWQQAERLVMAALHEFAVFAGNGHQLQRRLFVDDAVRGFAFVDLCRHQFDVVLMNPPFGEASLPSRDYLYAALPETARDLFAAFVLRWAASLSLGGRLGAITNRTAFFSDFLKDWRKRVFLGEVSALAYMADLGYGVLDAVVETAAYVCSRASVKESVFLSILSSLDKARSLERSINGLRDGTVSDNVFIRNPADFGVMPDYRFAYQFHPFWIARLNHGTVHPNYTSKAGLTTGDDFRFLRCFWEVPESELAREESRWRWLAKGGEFSRYRTDVHLMVDWSSKHLLSRTRNDELYGKRGVTYTERTTSNLSARVMNEGCCFSGAGPGVIPSEDEDLHFLLAYLNSSVASYCLEAMVGGGDFSMKGTAARHLEPGYLQNLPTFCLTADQRAWFKEKVESLVGTLNAHIDDETHPLFVSTLPGVHDSLRETALQCVRAYLTSLADSYCLVRMIEQQVVNVLSIPVQRIGDMYSDTGYPLPDSSDLTVMPEGWRSSVEMPLLAKAVADDVEPPEPRCRFENKLSHRLDASVERLAHRYQVSPEAICCNLASSLSQEDVALESLVANVLSFTVGCALGRWALPAKQPERNHVPYGESVFERLPVHQPAAKTDVAPDDHVILVDEPEHRDDIVRRLRAVLECVWADSADSIEREICDVLRVNDLRDYFRRLGKGGFWESHVSRYSKSRRKAPIYWLLQSSKRNYALWVYYHSLNKDILFKALVNYVEPKVRLEESRLESLRSQRLSEGASGKGAKKVGKDVDRQEAFVSELRDFEDKLRRAANRNLVPDLNDGVMLNIAHLWELVPWREAKDYWEELLEGKHEWSSIGKQLREKGLVK